MPTRKNSNIEKDNEQKGPSEHFAKFERMNQERDKVESAHEQADHDMEGDPDFSMKSPNDDLDEGEIARLGEDMKDII